MKKKLITVVGTRPEIIRLSRVFNALDASKSIKHYSVHTGQNYDFELNEIFYKLYDENFSTEEMQTMLTFFSTETGQHVLRTLPKIAAESQTLAKAHAKAVGPKIQMRIHKRLKEASQAPK